MRRAREDATFESILVPATDVCFRRLIESDRLESAGVANGSLFLSTVGASCRPLDRASSLVLVAKDVRVLVRSTSYSGLAGFFGEILFPPIFALNRSMVIRLNEIEGGAFGVVVVARLAIVVNNIVVRMAQHVSVVLSLPHLSGFCHVLQLRLY